MVKNFIWDLFRLFYPNLCLLCNSTLSASEKFVCFACKINLPETNYHLIPDSNPLYQNLRGRISIEAACSLYFFQKGLKVQTLLHSLKYNNKPEIGIYFGKYYGTILKNVNIFNDVAYIIPVPLHRKKIKIRGYNQSEQIAIGLAEAMNCKVDNESLQRVSYTETQTRKSRLKRWENVKERFSLVDDKKISNTHVIIVDDVITTGATIEACVGELLKAPNVRVSVVSLATTLF